MSFGYATGEFEVTADRLGVYRPEEHIGKCICPLKWSSLIQEADNPVSDTHSDIASHVD